MTAVGVFDLDKAVCDTHDINSVFSTQNFTSSVNIPRMRTVNKKEGEAGESRSD